MIKILGKLDRADSFYLKRKALLLILWTCLYPLFTTGCGSHIRVFLHSEVDMNYYERVAVVPFRSLTADRLSGEKFSIEFTTALLASGTFEVIDYGIFAKTLIQVVGSKAPSEGLSISELKKIKELTGIQGVFEGTVKQYEMVPTGGGTFPAISVEARLLDVETGNVVWMATTTKRGGPKLPVIGIGEVHTLGELSQRICKELIAKLE